MGVGALWDRIGVGVEVVPSVGSYELPIHLFRNLCYTTYSIPQAVVEEIN